MGHWYSKIKRGMEEAIDISRLPSDVIYDMNCPNDIDLSTKKNRKSAHEFIREVNF